MNKPNEKMSYWSRTILEQKYSHDKKEGGKETWDEVAERVGRTVLKTVGASKSQINDTIEIIKQRKFLPGGRYLYATGRQLHQTQNCLLMRAGDSREGWSELLHNSAMALMTGAGIGIDYSQVRAEGKLIRKTGGFSTGPLALMEMVNDCGRKIQQGGSRRSAIWAGLNWNHPDIHKFITMKNWIPEVREMKAKDFNFPATMDGTNISVLLDDEFFKAIENDKNPLHSSAQSVYWATVKQMLKTAEPGFSIDCGKSAKETLRNAPVCGETHVLTWDGYRQVSDILEQPTKIWTGVQWASDVVFHKTKDNAKIVRVLLTGGREIRCDEEHPFIVYDSGLIKTPAKELKAGQTLHVSLPINCSYNTLNTDYYLLGYVYGDGSFTNKGGAAEITFCTPESKKCYKAISESPRISSSILSDSRGYTRCWFKTDHTFFGNRSKDVFPVHMYEATSEQASSFVCGLFDADGNWEPTQKRIRLASKHEGFLRGVARLLEQYGILSHVSKSGFSTYGQAQSYQLVVASEYMQNFKMFCPCIRVRPKLDGYKSYRASAVKVLSVEEDGYASVYCADVKVPEHSFQAEGVIIGNCTEITSADDSDVCNLGSINLARIESLAEMERVTELATSFLLAGTVYSDVPYAKVDQIRTKNRRLGLGLMGIHEWLLTHGKQYGPDSELEEYLKIYTKTDEYAAKYAKEWDISCPVKTRAVAPNGTISIVAETTSGIEPIYCVAYKRRYLKGSTWHFQYVIDPTAKRLIESGINPEGIEDAYTLAENVERRVAFQAWVQKYVDHAISSTINIPAWGSELNNDSTVQTFGKMLLKYLPSLRGITCYPDGGRSGQPLSPVSYKTAIKHTDEVFVEAGDVCQIGHGESCGS